MTTLETVEDETGWPEARALWRLDPAVAHCNHGSFGAVPAPVAAAQQAVQERIHANPVRFFKRVINPAIAVAREAAASFVGADPAAFALIPNVTTGVSTVLAGFPLAAGDEILLTDHGYGAVALAVERACHRTGARAVTVDVPLDADPDTILAAITAGVTPRTALAVVDHVTSSTARRFPVERIVPALRATGVAVLVDGAHVPGMIPLDLDALAPDFWVGNFHKWACAAPGCAGLYLAPEWRGRVAPLVASWNEPFGFPYSFDQFGTTDLTSWLTLPVAFEVLGGLGWDRLRQHNGDLAAHGQAVVAEALGLDPATLVGDDGVSMRVVELPAGVGETYEAAYEVWERISAELGVEVGVNAWRGRGLLRVSAQAYNTPADYRRLADGLPLHRWPPVAGIRSG